MRRHVLALTLFSSAATVPALAQGPSQTCLPTVADAAAPGQCIPASSVPAAGALLPLGPELFVTPGGAVGIGTMSPSATLEVQGEVWAPYRAAFGDASSLVSDPSFAWDLDLTCRVDDFTSSLSWTPFRAQVVLDPPIDQVGTDARYVYSHDMIVRTPSTSTRSIEYMSGPYMLALHEGTGSIHALVGGLLGAESNHGTVDLQGGAFLVSLGDGDAQVVENSAADLQSGHWGALGSIERDYGLYVYTPYTDSKLESHYGIFLEDQDVGLVDSYAIYSQGGTSYFAGDLGLGTDTPTAKLDVNGDFVASGTKSFVQQHPYDPTKEVRFVCLEGNEAGTYFRGRARLVGGVATIDVPEDFALVSEELGLTVQLTPRGPGADLWVAEDGLQRLVVRGARDVEFDYLVNGVRRGYAGFETIRDRALTPSRAAAQGGRSPERERAREQQTRRMR